MKFQQDIEKENVPQISTMIQKLLTQTLEMTDEQSNLL